MQYKVPQDVQREDTIIGPVTIKQLAILGVGGTIAYALYISLAKTYFVEIWLPPVAIISALTLAFAFLKIHNLPFHKFLMNLIEYNLLAKQRIWIQGTIALPHFSNEPEDKKQNEGIENQKKEKKDIKKLTSILDSHGESELSHSEKKEGLNEIINQNYKK